MDKEGLRNRHLTYKHLFDVEPYSYHRANKELDRNEHFIDIIDLRSGEWVSNSGYIDRLYYERENPNAETMIGLIFKDNPMAVVAKYMNIDYALYMCEIIEYTGYLLWSE